MLLVVCVRDSDVPPDEEVEDTSVDKENAVTPFASAKKKAPPNTKAMSTKAPPTTSKLARLHVSGESSLSFAIPTNQEDGTAWCTTRASARKAPHGTP